MKLKIGTFTGVNYDSCVVFGVGVSYKVNYVNTSGKA